MNENKLKQILKKLDKLSNLSGSNVIDNLKQILQKEDPKTYAIWEEAKFDKNFNFPKDFGFLEGSRKEEFFSLLQVAASSGYTNTMKALIDAGADIVKVGASLENLRAFAANTLFRNQHKEYYTQQMSKNVIKRQNLSGDTLLHFAAQSGNTETVEFLLKEVAEVDVKNGIGDTPLIIAIENGHRNIVQLLRRNQADIHIQNDDGQSLLHLAAKGNNIVAAQILLEEGLDSYAQDNSGATPLDLAKKRAQNSWLDGMTVCLETYIPNKLFWAVLTRNSKTANKILNDCKENGNTAKILGNLVLRPTEAAKKENKDIIKSIQQAQAFGFGFATIMVTLFLIAVTAAVVFTSPACTVTGIVTAGVIGGLGLIGFGLAVYHGCKEIPSELSEPISTEAKPALVEV
ncbi:ankyrin repeat domain-containing protein [Wolbachia endosymbiont of Folsomia candida]|uniref:ankyrin repeat domain-containing protein n=1 Tax=Wolbachia endosymbiont of Folsomia candida TaxID=169402 RepID=UPI000A5618F4|nr:ankyrin repeat domain-containing protein [Wolbachia endosymbiont of Folsomia candida]APR98798.1 hypothetical protein ASM33_06240 [Wolbachia endosymbiont of Folsomia candida]